jgi:hypothetical protein
MPNLLGLVGLTNWESPAYTAASILLFYLSSKSHSFSMEEELSVISLRRRKRELQGRGQMTNPEPPPECYKGRVKRPITKSHTAPKLRKNE